MGTSTGEAAEAAVPLGAGRICGALGSLWRDQIIALPNGGITESLCYQLERLQHYAW